MASPVFNACPTCHEPRRPHRVCANCGSYKGSEVVAPSAHDHDHDH
jgi:large subunit ribosomal protein L32